MGLEIVYPDAQTVSWEEERSAISSHTLPQSSLPEEHQELQSLWPCLSPSHIIQEILILYLLLLSQDSSCLHPFLDHSWPVHIVVHAAVETMGDSPSPLSVYESVTPGTETEAPTHCCPSSCLGRTVGSQGASHSLC